MTQRERARSQLSDLLAAARERPLLAVGRAVLVILALLWVLSGWIALLSDGFMLFPPPA